MFVQDPSAVLDYTVDWTQWMPAPDGLADYITASTWAADPELTVQTSPAPTNNTTTATVWLTGGTAGAAYAVTNHITTNAGRQSVVTFHVSLVAGAPGDADRTYIVPGNDDL